MSRSLSTGEAARLLRVVEPTLSGLIRRGRIVPPPPIVAGRRAWSVEHVHCAARALGVDPPGAAMSATADAAQGAAEERVGAA
jgi:hypothetical protein